MKSIPPASFELCPVMARADITAAALLNPIRSRESPLNVRGRDPERVAGFGERGKS